MGFMARNFMPDFLYNCFVGTVGKLALKKFFPDTKLE